MFTSKLYLSDEREGGISVLTDYNSVSSHICKKQKGKSGETVFFNHSPNPQLLCRLKGLQAAFEM